MEIRCGGDGNEAQAYTLASGAADALDSSLPWSTSTSIHSCPSMCTGPTSIDSRTLLANPFDRFRLGRILIESPGQRDVLIPYAKIKMRRLRMIDEDAGIVSVVQRESRNRVTICMWYQDEGALRSCDLEALSASSCCLRSAASNRAVIALNSA